MIHQTKPSNLVLTIDNLLADVLIPQTFFHQILEKSQFAKLSPCQTFPLYVTLLAPNFWILECQLVVI